MATPRVTIAQPWTMRARLKALKEKSERKSDRAVRKALEEIAEVVDKKYLGETYRVRGG